jgi:hypothetical protein
MVISEVTGLKTIASGKVWRVNLAACVTQLSPGGFWVLNLAV